MNRAGPKPCGWNTATSRSDPCCAVAPDHDAVVAWAVAEARPGDTVLLMGARDPRLPGLARRIAAALS